MHYFPTPPIKDRGFTLIELMVVVAVISILAAIAVPTYTKYVREARTVEAIANLGTLAVMEETFQSENDTYVSTIANPSRVPNPGDPGGLLSPDQNASSGWALLGRAFPASEKLRFQYEVVAGAYDSNGNPVIGETGSLVSDITPASMGGSDCDVVGLGKGPLTAESLSIPKTPSSQWFFITAIADQDGNRNCSLFVKIVDRAYPVIEAKIE